MKAYLLLVIVAISISNVSSKRDVCQSCSTSWVVFWKHCKSKMKCRDGYCRKYKDWRDGKPLWIYTDCYGKRDQMLASLGNANEEDFPSIDLL